MSESVLGIFPKFDATSLRVQLTPQKPITELYQTFPSTKAPAFHLPHVGSWIICTFRRSKIFCLMAGIFALRAASGRPVIGLSVKMVIIVQKTAKLKQM